MEEFSRCLKWVVTCVIREAIGYASSFGIQVIGCGSSFDGSKIGFPDEFDFLIQLFSHPCHKGSREEGYERLTQADKHTQHLRLIGTYGVWFWDKLMSYWYNHPVLHNGRAIAEGKWSFRMPLPPHQRHPDHTTCTTWVWICSGDTFQDLAVSIDLVPGFHNEY